MSGGHGPTEIDTRVKVAIYRHFAKHGERPTPVDVAAAVDADADAVRSAYSRLMSKRVLVLDSDGESIRMAPPFSGVPTQHVVEANGLRYDANCAWDAFGVLAALRTPGTVHSRCEQSREPLHLEIGLDGPPASDWLFHCLVPAAKWWENIVFT